MTILILRTDSARFDDYGDPTTETPTEITAPSSCFVAPRSSLTVVDRGRIGVVEQMALYGPHDLDVVVTDLIDVDGVRYEIDGEPARYQSGLTGWKAGTEVPLRRATG